MQAILNAVPYLLSFTAPTVDVRAPSSTGVAALAGVCLLLSGAPDAGVVIGNQIMPLNDNRGDLTLSDVVARVSQHLPANQKKDAYRIGRTVMEVSDRHQFSPALILAVIEMESTYRFSVVSKSGAVGLMQLLPGTAAEVAKRYNIRGYKSTADLNDPVINIRLGVAYLSTLRRQFGQSTHYLAAYNMGPYGLKKRLASGNYELGALDPYVRKIHNRTRLLQAGKESQKLPGLRRAEALMASAI